jgi:hypothetical protein
MQPYMALARWLARKKVKAEWRTMGRNPLYADASVIADYFTEHRNDLFKEAYEHPVSIHYRHQERMRLARKAVIAEIRDRGGRVNSIAPEVLRRLIQTYLKEHPAEDNVIVEKVCF